MDLALDHFECPIGWKWTFRSARWMDRGGAVAMREGNSEPEIFWESILSGNPLRVLAAWETLAAEEREAVRRHLHRMAEEDGWQSAQRRAAEAALKIIKEAEPGG
jgi:hypothetical protein